jgi:hypothetical protein
MTARRRDPSDTDTDTDTDTDFDVGGAAMNAAAV